MDGFNVTIFAYGQTGAGKTFTMMGSKEQEGLMPRVANAIFEIVERDSKDRAFEVASSMIELYRGTCIDLLQAYPRTAA